MPKLEFLQNVRQARGLFRGPRVSTDHPGVDPENVAAQLAGAAIWLTPAAVRGFNLSDFPELSDERRRELQNAVEEFVQVAREVPGNQAATADQVRAGMTAFRKILEILEQDFPDRGETNQIREVLEGVNFPPFVLNWTFEVGEDWSGDPAVWVSVFIRDEVAGHPELVEETSKIRKRIHAAFADAGIQRWPFVRVRTATEQRTLADLTR